jgi:hypothetical protein
MFVTSSDFAHRPEAARIGKRVMPMLPLIGLVLFVSLASAGASGTTITFVGKAVDESGRFQYTERHDLTYEQGQVARSRTTYRDSENRILGDLVSEYLPTPQICSYDFRDLRARYEDGVRVNDDGLVLYKKEGPDANRETASLPRQANQIVGQGFHHFLALNRKSIAQGEIFHVELVLPSRLKQYSFRVRKRMVEGANLHIRLEIDNWFLRLFAPYVDCTYDLTTGRLLRYVGISNLADPSGSVMKVDITYTH